MLPWLSIARHAPTVKSAMPLMMNVEASAAAPSAKKNGSTGTMAAKANETPITLAARCGFAGLLGRPSSSVIISFTHWSWSRDTASTTSSRSGPVMPLRRKMRRVSASSCSRMCSISQNSRASSDSWSSRWLFVET